MSMWIAEKCWADMSKLPFWHSCDVLSRCAEVSKTVTCGEHSWP